MSVAEQLAALIHLVGFPIQVAIFFDGFMSSSNPSIHIERKPATVFLRALFLQQSAGRQCRQFCQQCHVVARREHQVSTVLCCRRNLGHGRLSGWDCKRHQETILPKYVSISWVLSSLTPHQYKMEVLIVIFSLLGVILRMDFKAGLAPNSGHQQATAEFPSSLLVDVNWSTKIFVGTVVILCGLDKDDLDIFGC